MILAEIKPKKVFCIVLRIDKMEFFQFSYFVRASFWKMLIWRIFVMNITISVLKF